VRCPLRVVDERVPVALLLEGGGVSVTLVLRDGLGLVPADQRRDRFVQNTAAAGGAGRRRVARATALFPAAGPKSSPPNRLVVVKVVGVDGTRGGWIAIALDDGCFAGDYFLDPIETDFEELADAGVIAIDVPIGFGPHQADVAARGFLNGAASTVFSTPTRDVLTVPFGPGLGVSAQAHALGPRILHVTRLAESDARIYEVHPEVSFRAMNDGRPLAHRKKSAGGALERVELLRKTGIELVDLDASANAPLDDVLDAAAAAWSAHRIANGSARTLPSPPEDVDGRAVAIWY
jgi:predicted RNase H-like nuclease